MRASPARSARSARVAHVPEQLMFHFLSHRHQRRQSLVLPRAPGHQMLEDGPECGVSCLAAPPASVVSRAPRVPRRTRVVRSWGVARTKVRAVCRTGCRAWRRGVRADAIRHAQRDDAAPDFDSSLRLCESGSGQQQSGPCPAAAAARRPPTARVERSRTDYLDLSTLVAVSLSYRELAYRALVARALAR